MSSDATDNPAVELQALRWDGQDVPAAAPAGETQPAPVPADPAVSAADAG